MDPNLSRSVSAWGRGSLVSEMGSLVSLILARLLANRLEFRGPFLVSCA